MDTWVRPLLFEMVLRTMGLELFLAFLANFFRKLLEVLRTNFAKYGLVAGSTETLTSRGCIYII
jgi:hypothetical protein